MQNKVVLTGDNITVRDVINVAYFNAKVELSEEARDKIKKCRHFIEDAVKKKLIIYGVNTGFGALSTEILDENKIIELQENLLKSHSAGVGKDLPIPIVRAAMFLRAHMFTKGHSGVRLELVEKIIELLNKNIIPAVPEKGSVGASGDLAPLSHMALALIGEGFVYVANGGDYTKLPTKKAFELKGIKPLKLSYKEGLALNNGTQISTATGIVALYDAIKLFLLANISTSLSLEGLAGIKDAFDDKIQEARPYRGQKLSAEIIRALVKDSKLSMNTDDKILLQDIIAYCKEKERKLTLCFSKKTLYFRGIDINSLYKWFKRTIQENFKNKKISCTLEDDSIKKEYHIILSCESKDTICQLKKILENNSNFDYITKRNLSDIQDAYSLRCAPQVHGAVFETIDFVKKILGTEINSIVDNPLVFPETQQVISGGNFHGEPIGFAMDFLGIAVAELANISERRIFRLLDPKLNRKLPPFLIGAHTLGLHSGLMLTQYTAASLVSENKVLAHPATVDSIPTSANQEDHVSMSANAALKVLRIIENTKYVLSIEILNAIQAIYLRAKYADKIPTDLLSSDLAKIVNKISKRVEFPINSDRIFRKDIDIVYSILDDLIEPLNPLSFL